MEASKKLLAMGGRTDGQWWLVEARTAASELRRHAETMRKTAAEFESYAREIERALPVEDAPDQLIAELVDITRQHAIDTLRRLP